MIFPLKNGLGKTVSMYGRAIVNSDSVCPADVPVGSAEKGEGIHYLVETYRPLFPTKRLTPTTIRQSVITQLLKSGMDLRVVQVFAGHKKASTTEKYRQTNLEELRAVVQRYHPLG